MDLLSDVLSETERRRRMHKLAVTLPPFSPDYSGACSALFELGGMLIIHDASGCTGNYTSYDEPRWYGSKSLVYCSALREIDAVMGNDDKFINKICTAAIELEPKFICILGSPVPMVIGTDFSGIALEIEEKTGIPAFGFATKGLNYYDKGVSDAFLAISKRFITSAYKKRRHTINIIGATPIDFTAGSNVRDFCKEFEARGFDVLATYAMDCNIEKLKESSAASVNVVISAGGFALAKHFEKTFGTPYVVGQPMGDKQCDRLCELIEKAEDTGNSFSVQIPQVENSNILLIGEQVTMHSLRCCLYEDFGIMGVDIGCTFLNIPDITASSDIALNSEKEIMNTINSGKYTHVIGDPLFENLIEEPINFISLPHVAVSGKLYWNNSNNLAGRKINNILKGVI